MISRVAFIHIVAFPEPQQVVLRGLLKITFWLTWQWTGYHLDFTTLFYIVPCMFEQTHVRYSWAKSRIWLILAWWVVYVVGQKNRPGSLAWFVYAQPYGNPTLVSCLSYIFKWKEKNDSCEKATKRTILKKSDTHSRNVWFIHSFTVYETKEQIGIGVLLHTSRL